MQQFSSLLSWRLFTAQHVSGVLAPINRSSVTAVVASGFTFLSWWQPCCVRGQAGYHHYTKVKPEAANAIVELLLMGGRTPETCWAVNKRQDNKLKNCLIWLVIYLNFMLSGCSLKKLNHSKIFIVTRLGLEGAWYWQTLIVVLCLGLFYGHRVWGRSLFYRKRLHHMSDSHILRCCFDHVRNAGCQCWQPCSLCVRVCTSLVAP